MPDRRWMERWPAHTSQGMLMAATNGHERLEKAARALNVTSQSSGVILTRNTARPHDGEVICTYHFLRRVGPCPFHRSAQDLTLRCGTRKPAKGQLGSNEQAKKNQHPSNDGGPFPSSGI